MTKYTLTLSLFLITLYSLHAQELKCFVKVNNQQVQLSNKEIIEELEDAAEAFLNERKWTDDDFEEQERISCNLLINLTSSPNPGEFVATLQFKIARPVFNSDYQSPLMLLVDRNVRFSYNESQPMLFNEGGFTDNLTSILAFYAYTIIGLDYDSFAEVSGTFFYQQALNVANNAQNNGFEDWDKFGSKRSRYNLNDNLLNVNLEPMRRFIYQYHRKGLDLMTEDPETARKNIVESFKMLKEGNNNLARTPLILSIIDSKKGEFANVFSEGDLSIKKEAFNLLSEIAPASTSDFQKILE